MRIPIWQRDQAHPTKAIDRLQNHRSNRQLIGLWASEDFSALSAALVQVKGTGKFARYSEKDVLEIELEDSAKQALCDLAVDSSPSESDLQFIGTELAAYQADVCLKLLARSGVTASEVVAIGVMDPGIEIVDFEGRSLFRSLSNAIELASRTSITVIDRFRERDILDGGTGKNLLALGYWFLLGDRNPKIAEEDRLMVLNGSDSWLQVFFLPASDGLDASLPDIKVFQIPNSGEAAAELAKLVGGLQSRDSELRFHIISDSNLDVTKGLGVGVKSSTLQDFRIQHIESVACAFLANSFVDQLPVSIPELTGNQNPKVLGSLTPGSLVNFRNFVQHASKSTPSIMKLRDAI